MRPRAALARLRPRSPGTLGGFHHRIHRATVGAMAEATEVMAGTEEDLPWTCRSRKVGLALRTEVRKYESTFVRKYNRTKVRKYESTKVLSKVLPYFIYSVGLQRARCTCLLASGASTLGSFLETELLPRPVPLGACSLVVHHEALARVREIATVSFVDFERYNSYIFCRSLVRDKDLSSSRFEHSLSLEAVCRSCHVHEVTRKMGKSY